MLVKGLDHLNLTVHNLPQIVKWYKNVFGFTVVEEGIVNGKPSSIIQCGEAMLCLYENEDVEAGKNGSTLNHFGVRISNREQWEETIEREDIIVLYDGPVRWPHSTAWYIHDPMGHEIKWYCGTMIVYNFNPLTAE